MDKLILREIAKRWCKGILLANDITDSETMELLSDEEQDYLIRESEKIANRITKKSHSIDLNETIKEYYNFE